MFVPGHSGSIQAITVDPSGGTLIGRWFF